VVNIRRKGLATVALTVGMKKLKALGVKHCRQCAEFIQLSTLNNMQPRNVGKGVVIYQ